MSLLKLISSQKNERTSNILLKNAPLSRRRKLISLEENEKTLDLPSENESRRKRMKLISSEGNELTLGHPLEENTHTLEETSSHYSEAPSGISLTSQVHLGTFRENPQILESDSSSDSSLSAYSSLSASFDVSEMLKEIGYYSDFSEGETCEKTGKSKSENEPPKQEIYLSPITNSPGATLTSTESYHQHQSPRTTLTSTEKHGELFEIRDDEISENYSDFIRQMRDITLSRSDTQDRIKDDTFTPMPSPEASDLNTRNHFFFPDIQHVGPKPNQR